MKEVNVKFQGVFTDKDTWEGIDTAGSVEINRKDTCRLMDLDPHKAHSLFLMKSHPMYLRYMQKHSVGNQFFKIDYFRR